MTCKRAYVKIIDSSQWLTHGICIETYGTSASEHGDIASGILHKIIDTVPLQEIFEQILAMASGNIEKSGYLFSYKKRDNSTNSFTLSAGATARIRQ